jgi:hypothetical protein
MTGTGARAVRVGAPAASRWRTYRHRVIVPFLVLGVIFAVTGVAHRLEEPGGRDTLMPSGTGPDGSSRLAALLAERGVRIEAVAEFTEAAAALEGGGDAVLFIPKPNFASSVLAQLAAIGPGNHRIVMVAPRGDQLWFTDPAVVTGDRRWASAAVPPGCDLPEAVAAGRATALRGRYAVDGPGDTCYQQGLVRTEMAGAELFVIGATDPFRNRRIGEHGNAELAVGLLSAADRVVWADSLSVDLELPAIQWPQLQAPSRPERDRSPSGGLAELGAPYPPGLLAGLALAALLALLVALARARRLGPPVTEPLPVSVPAAEAVAGRGRLYQRVRGRGVALAALRAAALHRLVPVLGLPANPPPEPGSVVAAVVARTGLSAEHVRRTLYGPEPDHDRDLAEAVSTLDRLVGAVTIVNPAEESTRDRDRP